MGTGLTRKQRLQELEGVIERGLATFYEVGHALMEILEEKLYTDSAFAGWLVA